MIDAWLNKISYKIGEELQIFLDFGSNENLLDDISNINVNISSIKRERNHLALGFGHTREETGSVVTIQRKIPDTFREGLYLVGGVRLIPADDKTGNVVPVTPNDITKLFFWVSDDQNLELTALELTEKINQLDSERANYNNTIRTTEAATGSVTTSQYRVLVFGVGCLIHSTQNMEGYALHPLKTGYSYVHMLDAVNSYTTSKYGIKLEEVDSIRTSFSSSTPLFVIDFSNVKAINPTDAGNYCSQESENIFTVLAYDRGQRPNSFATIIIDEKTRQSWQGFHFPGYRGNLVSDFSPTSTAETLDRLLPKLGTSSWLDLIMRIYADAESESNPHYACLKFWSILEMISKREVSNNSIELTYPNGDKILDHGGTIVKTNSALGKAYKHSFDLEIPPSHVSLNSNSSKLIFETYLDATANPDYDDKTRIVTLWDRLSAMYQVRNSTAHSGKFDHIEARRGSAREKLAAELWDLEYQTFLREVGSMMKIIVSHELTSA